MLPNSKCHLQFLEIYLFHTLCHIACILPLTKQAFGLMEVDGEWRMLNVLFEGQTLFLSESELSGAVQRFNEIANYN